MTNSNGSARKSKRIRKAAGPPTKMPVTMMLFLGVLGVSILVCALSWIYLPDHDLHPMNHPLDNLHHHHHASITENHHVETKHESVVGNDASTTRAASDSSTPNYHMVFSTSCSPFQDWQSYVFFYFAWKINQPGTITRIASGCKPKQIDALNKIHEEQIAIMSDSFKLHFAPAAPDTRSKYFNKPFGLKSFMESVLGYPNDTSHDDDIIMIVDPDMMLLRPLTHKFDFDKVSWVHKPTYDTVTHGHPISQAYGFGSAWLNSLQGNASHVAGSDSPALHLKEPNEASQYYPAGPPYLATARDMYNIAVHWCDFVPRIHDIFPKFMSEMHGYSFAAAHLKLPHQLAYSFMVSDVGINEGEGWGFLKEVDNKDVCKPDAIDIANVAFGPYVLHYCQRYALGRWFVGKYKLSEHFFDCDAEMLREPPDDVAVKYNWFIYPNGKDVKNYTNKPLKVKQNGWAMCRMIDNLNDVATNFKSKHCEAGNFNKTYIFHRQDKFDEFLNGVIPDLVNGEEDANPIKRKK